MTSLRDVLLVARFDVLRALRTWWAGALFLLYGLATAGAAWAFIKLVGVMENALAAAPRCWKRTNRDELEEPVGWMDYHR